MDSKALAAAVVKSLRGFVTRSVEPLTKRMDSLEKKEIPPRPLSADERREMAESMLPHVEAAFSKWALDFERNATDIMLKAVSNIPEPENGKDGRDGLDWSEFDIELKEDGRTLVVSLGSGDKAVSREIKTHIPVFRGSWKADEDYSKADCVNWGGNMWIAKREKPGRPTDGDGWQLAVRRGADAKVS